MRNFLIKNQNCVFFLKAFFTCGWEMGKKNEKMQRFYV